MAGAAHLEVESKFDVSTAFALPDLQGLPGVSTVDQPQEQRLEATYLDTADLRLLRHRITLRRRTGGTDAGWHLKLPGVGSARLEVHRPLGRGTRTVPAQLAALVRVRVRGTAIVPVATLSTRRTVHRLLGADGAVLAEVADDTVVAQTLATEPGEDTTSSTWREVEVELVTGGPKLLQGADAVLRAAGALPAASGSKVARALTAKLARTGVAAPGAPAPAEDGRKATKGGGQRTGESKGQATGESKGRRGGGRRATGPTAGDVALAYVAGQVEELQAWDPQVRVDAEDAVHKMRVATRRLRSAFATFRPLVDRAATDRLREELKWLGGVLGAARDAEVLHARLRAAVDALPTELVVGPVTARIDDELRTAYREAHEAVLVELDGARYLALVEDLESLVANPPLTDEAAAPAGKELRLVVRRTRRRVERAVAALEAAQSVTEHDQLLHEVRKAAKRARYAGESVAGQIGKKATVFAAAMERIQEALGLHQDSVVARDHVLAMGTRAQQAGENAFTFGLLYGLEMAQAAEQEARFHAAWADTGALTWP